MSAVEAAAGNLDARGRAAPRGALRSGLRTPLYRRPSISGLRRSSPLRRAWERSSVMHVRRSTFRSASTTTSCAQVRWRCMRGFASKPASPTPSRWRSRRMIGRRGCGGERGQSTGRARASPGLDVRAVSTSLRASGSIDMLIWIDRFDSGARAARRPRAASWLSATNSSRSNCARAPQHPRVRSRQLESRARSRRARARGRCAVRAKLARPVLLGAEARCIGASWIAPDELAAHGLELALADTGGFRMGARRCSAKSPCTR